MILYIPSNVFFFCSCSFFLISFQSSDTWLKGSSRRAWAHELTLFNFIEPSHPPLDFDSSHPPFDKQHKTLRYETLDYFLTKQQVPGPHHFLFSSCLKLINSCVRAVKCEWNWWCVRFFIIIIFFSVYVGYASWVRTKAWIIIF
jgi:hypothetical protein